MMPLARAMRRRGHAVAWATAPDALADLAALDVVPLPVGMATKAARLAYLTRWPEAQFLEGEALSDHTYPLLFGAVIARAMLDDLADASTRWKPDLVISEPAAFAAALVCTRDGITRIEHGLGLLPPASRTDAAMRQLLRRVPAQEWPDASELRSPLCHLDVVPAALRHSQPDASERSLPLRVVDTPGAEAGHLPPAWERALQKARGPAIHVTFGTVFDRRPALRVAVEAAARVGAEVFVTLGRDGDVGDPGSLAPSVRVARFIDQSRLYAGCDLTVSHGGAAAMLGAAAHGAPHVVLPQAADHFRNASALEAAGAGIAVQPTACSVDAVEAALRHALAGPSFRVSAKRVASAIAAMPGPDHVAAEIESRCGAG